MKGLKRMLVILQAFVYNVLILVAVTAVMQVVVDDSPIVYQWENASLLVISIVPTQTLFILPRVNPPSIPLMALLASQSNCYCETGSFFALFLSILTSLWLFEPFMVLSLV